jgi:hypothetical protein
MGRSPVQVDIINEASGISFMDCYRRRNVISVEDIEISTISRDDLIRNKKASGRHRDLADAEGLEEEQVE